MKLLRIENVTKKYMSKKALDDLSFTAGPGKIYGLLGPNGSGKTTLLRMLAGLIQPSGGSIEIIGNRIGKNTKEVVSFMPTINHLPKWMKVKQCIGYYHDFFTDFDMQKAKENLKFMGLNEAQKVGTLSTGMLGRLKISLALARNAKIFLLDEPFNGIDPVSREKIKEVIINVCNEGNAVIITSHLVNELETFLDEVVLIGDGHVILAGNVEALREEKGKSLDELYREVFADA